MIYLILLAVFVSGYIIGGKMRIKTIMKHNGFIFRGNIYHPVKDKDYREFAAMQI